MSRTLLGLVGAVGAIGVFVAVMLGSVSGARNNVTLGPTPAAAALEHPYGELRDKNDVGEEHFRMGRYPEAIDHWTAAAEKGSAYAAHRLGVEYMNGQSGVFQQDYSKARRYHLQAARAGYTLSMFDLGSMCEFGQGASPSISDAAKWYGHSASYGLAQGQYNYATMLEAGEGVPVNTIEALKFYILAARGGFAGVPYDAARNKIDQQLATPLEVLQGKMSKADADEAKARADRFVPATGPLTNE